MSLAEDDGAGIREALTTLQQGDGATAEGTLRLEIKSRPTDGADPPMALPVPCWVSLWRPASTRCDSRFAGLLHRIRF
jgi:hypothetical protein